jgi:hypothetical protein
MTSGNAVLDITRGAYDSIFPSSQIVPSAVLARSFTKKGHKAFYRYNVFVFNQAPPLYSEGSDVSPQPPTIATGSHLALEERPRPKDTGTAHIRGL